jgi:Tetratricopeptide repeat
VFPKRKRVALVASKGDGLAMSKPRQPARVSLPYARDRHTTTSRRRRKPAPILANSQTPDPDQDRARKEAGPRRARNRWAAPALADCDTVPVKTLLDQAGAKTRTSKQLSKRKSSKRKLKPRSGRAGASAAASSVAAPTKTSKNPPRRGACAAGRDLSVDALEAALRSAERAKLAAARARERIAHFEETGWLDPMVSVWELAPREQPALAVTPRTNSPSVRIGASSGRVILCAKGGDRFARTSAAARASSYSDRWDLAPLDQVVERKSLKQRLGKLRPMMLRLIGRRSPPNDAARGLLALPRTNERQPPRLLPPRSADLVAPEAGDMAPPPEAERLWTLTTAAQSAEWPARLAADPGVALMEPVRAAPKRWPVRFATMCLLIAGALGMSAIAAALVPFATTGAAWQSSSVLSEPPFPTTSSASHAEVMPSDERRGGATEPRVAEEARRPAPDPNSQNGHAYKGARPSLPSTGIGSKIAVPAEATAASTVSAWGAPASALATAARQRSDRPEPAARINGLYDGALRWDEIYHLAHEAQKAGELTAAIEFFQAAARLQPRRAVVAYDLGYALQLQGDLEAAIAQYRLALTIQPDHHYASFNLNALLKKIGVSR